MDSFQKAMLISFTVLAIFLGSIVLSLSGAKLACIDLVKDKSAAEIVVVCK